MSKKECAICGRGDGALTADEKRRNLTASDVKLGHCQNCGTALCGLCLHLGVCCDGDENDE